MSPAYRPLDGLRLRVTATPPAPRLTPVVSTHISRPISRPIPQPKRRRSPMLPPVFAMALAVLCLLVIGAPYLPALGSPKILPSTASSHLPTSSSQPIASESRALAAPAAVISVADPGINQLTIPDIGVDGEIVDGADESALNQGIWHRPGTSTPDKGGNTVLAAHRFLYTSGPKTFYYLDRLKVGQQFSLRWLGQRYTYEISQTMTVSNRQVSIEENTKEAEVTLYTCTPLWTSKDRLVVVGKLVNSK